jgi:hypothetical protein
MSQAGGNKYFKDGMPSTYIKIIDEYQDKA